MARSNFSLEKSQNVDGIDVMCVAIIHTVAFGDPVGGPGLAPTSTLSDSTIGRVDHQTSTHKLNIMRLPGAHLPGDDEYDRMVRGIEQRAQWLVRNLLTSDENFPPSRFFQWLLWLYFSSSSLSSSPAQGGNHHHLQLAVMMLLHLLCEQVPPAALFHNSSKDQPDEAIFPLIKLILISCADRRSFGIDDGSPIQDDVLSATSSFVAAERVLLSYKHQSPTSYPAGIKNETLDPQDRPETLLFSIGSIVLSLLVAILELGVDHRPREQEDMLQSFMPFLEHLAAIPSEPLCQSGNSSTSSSNDDEDEAVIRNLDSHTDVAGLASHAMVLIASRKSANDESKRSSSGTSGEDAFGKTITWESVLDQARCDLASDQPPIRARGVVSLRHFVRDDWFSRATRESDYQGTSLIVELTGTIQVPNTERMINNFLLLCLEALSDNESFVYLAAIHTIVAAADNNPRLVIPQLARALCSGKTSFLFVEGNRSPNDEIRLTVEQRIKVAEALILVIRRRASINEYIPLLMTYLVFGTDRGTPELTTIPGTPSPTMIEIQTATHEYFIRGNDTNDEDYEPTKEERMEAQSIRVGTGGPLFQIEENDLLRASCIQIVAEVVMFGEPAVMAQYCPTLVNLGVNVLKVDSSRPTRRAAALLSRELYAAVRREFDYLLSSRNQMGRRPGDIRLFTIEFVGSGEEKLSVALESAVAANYGIGDSRQQSVGLDPATITRCQEALELRMECQQSGILAAAKMVVDARRQDSKNPAVKLLKERLREGSDGDVIQLLLGGEVN